MTFDWRSRKYRGGSRWISTGVIAVSVGLSLPAAVEVIADAIVITVVADDRTIAVVADDRTLSAGPRT